MFSLKILIVMMVVIVFGLYYFSDDEPNIVKNDPIIGTKTEVKKLKEPIDPQSFDPKDSIEKYIGQDGAEVWKAFGEPDRIDRTEFEYSWWIYASDIKRYKQFAVSDGKVVSAIGAGNRVNVQPFRIGQDAKEINSMIVQDSMVEMELEDTQYRFELAENDYLTNPLIVVDQNYAQVYIDQFTGAVTAVRFMDKETLAKLRPYQLSFIGELYQLPELTDNEWQEVQTGYERSVIEFTNVIRYQFDLDPLVEQPDVSAVSRLHSQDMYERGYFNHETPDNQTLANRMDEHQIDYRRAGENIAAQHVDAVAAVAGWLNSEGHRLALLDAQYKYIGSGVYRKYYTQNFIEGD